MKRSGPFLLLLLATACGGAATDPVPAASEAASSDSSALRLSYADRRKALFALDDWHSALIRAFGPIDGLLAPVDENATLLVANREIITGRHAIRAALESLYPRASEITVQRTLAGGNVSVDGRLGFTFGFIEQTRREAGGSPVVTYGTYISIWELQHGRPRVAAYYTRSSTSNHTPPRVGFPLLADGPGLRGVPHGGCPEQQRRTLLDTDAQFAALSVAQGISVAFPAYAAEDLLITGSRDHYYLEGPAEIAAWYAGSTPAEEVLDWAPIIADASPSGDLGYTIGTYTDRLIGPNGTASIAYGKYLTIWLRQADGSWRYIGDGGAPSPAPSP